MQFLTSAHRKQPLFQGSALTKMSVTTKINARLENINEENMCYYIAMYVSVLFISE